MAGKVPCFLTPGTMSPTITSELFLTLSPLQEIREPLATDAAFGAANTDAEGVTVNRTVPAWVTAARRRASFLFAAFATFGARYCVETLIVTPAANLPLAMLPPFSFACICTEYVLLVSKSEI